MIGFNKPHIGGKEIDYIIDAVKREKISGNGYFTRRCQDFLEKRYGIRKVLLTTSCTDALEMAALLIGIELGDEVIMPSYTFVSTANAFALRGAAIIFADSSPDNPNMDIEKLEALITRRTKAIVIVHYAGFSCDMDRLMTLAGQHDLYVIEDAAQAIESTYKGRALGSIGHLGCISFHETKNVISGEGGALLINDSAFINRAEIIWEKGTNRSAFARGEVDKYNWIDLGSSFLPSEITAAFLFAQLEQIEEIQKRRHLIWDIYYNTLKDVEYKGFLGLPLIPSFNGHNAHIFYLVCRSERERNELLDHLNSHGINAIFHYIALHKSPYFTRQYKGKDLYECDRYTSSLLRLPIYFELSAKDAHYIAQTIIDFYREIREDATTA